MPVQVGQNKFVQFRYFPDYLQDEKWAVTVTDPVPVTASLNLDCIQSNLFVDGGNVIKGKDWIILTDKVFVENRGHDRAKILSQLETLLEVRPIIIPRDPYDFTRSRRRHGTLLRGAHRISKPLQEGRQSPCRESHNALQRAGLRTIEVPYDPYGNASYDSARGVCINYLQMRNFILLPVFDLPEDEENMRLFEQLFPGVTIATINANAVAEDGGVLNCITSNIQL
jgi:agmatine deiminase